MSSGVTCTIKIKPYIKEFIVFGFLNGSNKSSSTDALGFVIKPWLTKPPSNNIVNIAVNDNPEYFTFELPYYHDKNVKHNWYIPPQGQKYIEDVFEIMMKRNMFPYIDNLMEKHSFNIKDCIIDWCYSYNISFAYINYEMLKKSYYRYRKNDKKLVENCPAFVPHLSRTCPVNLPSNSHETVL